MFAVELNVSPIDEYILGFFFRDLPTGCPSQSVGIENHPLLSASDPTWSSIEPNGNTFVSDIQAIAGDLIAMREHIAVVHRAPDLDVARLWTSRVASR